MLLPVRSVTVCSVSTSCRNFFWKRNEDSSKGYLISLGSFVSDLILTHVLRYRKNQEARGRFVFSFTLQIFIESILYAKRRVMRVQ